MQTQKKKANRNIFLSKNVNRQSNRLRRYCFAVVSLTFAGLLVVILKNTSHDDEHFVPKSKRIANSSATAGAQDNGSLTW